MTLNLAHRGARLVAPENTLEAFQKAMDLGADGIELDVQLSADGHLFVLHDLTLERTTDGIGAAVSFPLAALKEFDAGSYFGEGWRGTRLPTLDEVFDLLPSHTFVNIELKRDSFQPDGLEGAITEFIRRRSLSKRVIVSSFNPIILWRLRKQPFPLGLLYDDEMAEWARYGQSRHWLRLEALHPPTHKCELPCRHSPLTHGQ